MQHRRRVHRIALATLVLGFASSPAAGAAESGDEAAILYAMGAALGRSLSPLSLEPEQMQAVSRGMTDAALGRELEADPRTFQQKILEYHAGRMAELSAAEAKASAAFLEKSAEQVGAVRTESGLVFHEISAGDGAQPAATDRVRVHYHGTLRDGSVFDSSVDRGTPAEFALDRVIPCWTEALQRMRVGGKSRLICPASIAYGAQGRPPQIPGGAALSFEVELLEIVAPGS